MEIRRSSFSGIPPFIKLKYVLHNYIFSGLNQYDKTVMLIQVPELIFRSYQSFKRMNNIIFQVIAYPFKDSCIVPQQYLSLTILIFSFLYLFFLSGNILKMKRTYL